MLFSAEYAMKFAEKKGFKFQDISQIKHAMRCKLNELSYAYRQNTSNNRDGVASNNRDGVA